MRSQIFGFPVRTHYMAKAILPCPLKQAYESVRQHTRTLEAHAPWLDRQQTGVGYRGDAYTVGFEVALNEWSEEVQDVVMGVLRALGGVDELLRMHTFKQALAWQWPNMRETITIAQFMLSATIDGDTHMSLQIGWNDGAGPEDIKFAFTFVSTCFHHLEQLKIHTLWMTPSPKGEETVSKRHYGPRPETLEKIQQLMALRDEYVRDGKVVITWTSACELVGITPSVVKKHRPELYERWYELDEGDPG